jgi:hypothetical protein
MKKHLMQSLCLFFVAGLACLWSQQAGVLAGRITAISGAGVPNAAVTITNASTKASQKVLSGPNGAFSISGLQPGAYRVDVEMAGFKHATAQTITLGPGNNNVNLNVTLEPGNVNEVVAVTGTSPALQDTNAELGVGLGMRLVQELPVVDRNHQQLAGLEIGVTPPEIPEDTTFDPARNRIYSTEGQSPLLNQYFTEGLLNQEVVRGVAIRVIPEEAIEQTNLTVANPTMNKGFVGGAFFMDNMRSGTNGFHGSLFEFWNGNSLDTRSYISTVGISPRFTYNQFGAAGGGAIRKDRTFLFGSYEGTYQRGRQAELSTVPTTAALTGDFSAIPGITVYAPMTGTPNGVGRIPFAGNVIPSVLIDPFSAAVASFFPAPNLPGFANNLVSNQPFQTDYQRFDGRLDHRVGDHMNLFLRYGYSNDYQLLNSPLGPVIGDGTRDRVVAQNSSIGSIRDFGPHLTSELRFGYNRYDQKLASSANQDPLGAALGLTGSFNGLGNLNIPGVPIIGPQAYLPEHPVDNTFNWVWAWNYFTAKHHFQWGTDIRRLRSDYFLDADVGGLFGPNGTDFFGPGATLSNNGAPLAQFSQLYNSVAAFLLDAPSQAGIANYQVLPSYRQSQYGFWVGDTMQIFKHVTLDLGARWEVYSPVEPGHSGGAAFFQPATNTFNYAGIGGVSMQQNGYNYANLAPRIGIAGHVSKKTVIRAGYSIQYFEQPLQYSGLMAPMAGVVAGVQGTYSVANLSLLSGGVPPTPLVNGTPASDLPVSITPGTLKTSSLETYHVQLQREFYYGTVLTVGYVGSEGHHLLGITELNQSFPGTGLAGLPFLPVGRTGSVLLYNNEQPSNYNALQASLSKRFDHGISFLASYTYGKSLGYTTANNLILDPYSRAQNYGPLDFDRQQVLAISHLWELPFGRHAKGFAKTLFGGWQVNGIFSWATGTPLTLTADPLLCDCVGATILASAVTPVNTTGNYGIGQSYINGTFVPPTGSTAGNLARGALRGPGIENYDMSVFKNFRMHERYDFQLRGEFFNLSNTPRLINPVTNINAANFGQITGIQNGSLGRQINLALRIQF